MADDPKSGSVHIASNSVGFRLWFVVWRVLALIFLVEYLIMCAFEALPNLPDAVLPIIDACSLSLISAPLIYFWIVRPLRNQLTRSIAESVEARQEAERASRTKSEFLANMSHEIRTPLNGICGMLQLLESTPCDETQSRFLHGAKISADCLLGLINDILDFSKIEAGRLELESVDVNLPQLVEDVAEMLSVRAEEKGIELCCDLDHSVPMMIRSDMVRLRQILVNLVNNALKFTERGTILIRARCMEYSKTEHLVRVEVVDTGIGIPADRRDRLFQLFSQVDVSTTRRFGGTGLGLALCRKLVSILGGEIGVESEEERGSTFWFTVPVRMATDHRQSLVCPLELRNMRVLVVDDNATSLDLLSGGLHRCGVYCRGIQSTELALVELRAAAERGRPFEVLVLDFGQQDATGSQLVASIRGSAEFAELPILLLMGIGVDVSTTQLDAWRPAMTLRKPVRVAQLLEAVRALKSDNFAAVPHPPAEQAASAPILPSRQCRVLIAEDNDINQVVVRELVSRMGYSPTVVGDGTQAIEYAMSREFDLVLMDCQMPNIDGFKATEEIRRREAGAQGFSRNHGRLPIIALTANATITDRQACLAAGMDDYLTKPVDRDALSAVLRKWLPGVAPDGGFSRRQRVADRTVSSSDDASCFDSQELLERCVGDVELAVELIGMFAESGEERLSKIEDLISARDRDGLVSAAHAIKGVASNLGAKSLHRVAAKFNEDYRHRQGDLGALVQDAQTIQLELKRCLEAAPAVRESIASL